MTGPDHTLADVADRTDVLVLACRTCDLARRHSVEELVRRYGQGITMRDLLRVLSAGCPMRELVSASAVCGVYVPDMGA